MKTSMTLKSIALATVFGAALTATVMAQPGPGMGGGAGPGAGMQGAGPGSGPMGPGGRGMRGMRFDKNNTPGWTLMTAEERTAHQAKMRAVKTYDECKLMQAEQHTAMEARAKEKGVTLNAPGRNGCDVAKARGLIK
ncbi:MAG: hypothetical protein WAW73_09930 [Rhodoferax sp.]